MLDRLQGKVVLIAAFGFALAAILGDADDVVAAAPMPRQTDDRGQRLRAIFGQQQVAEDRQVIAALKDDLLACVAGEFFLFQNARSQRHTLRRKAAEQFHELLAHLLLPAPRRGFILCGEAHRRRDALV